MIKKTSYKKRGITMKKRIMSLLLAVIMILGIIPFWALPVSAEETEEQTVFEISRLIELDTLAGKINDGTYETEGMTVILTGEIGRKPSSDDDWGSAKLTRSIGNADHPFKGTFIGNGNTVWLNSQNALFGVTENAVIKNVITGGRVIGEDETGICAGLVYEANDTVIEDCENHADITSYGCSGLVGYSYGSTLNGCKNYGTVTATGGGASGIAYYAGTSSESSYASEIKNCINAGTVLGCQDAGGIVKEFADGKIYNCVSTGYVYSSADFGFTGGFASSVNNGVFDNIYVGGNVGGNGKVGSIAGDNNYSNQNPHIYTSVADIPGCGTGVLIEPETAETLSDAASLLDVEVQDHEDWCFWRVKTISGTEELRMVKRFSGLGVQGYPYIIENVDQFELFADLVNGLDRNYADKCFTLAADIGDENDPVLTVIGDREETKFSGTFDGAGYTVYLYIKSENNAAMFGYTAGATVKNVITSGNVESRENAAGLVCNAINSEITDCHNKADIMCGNVAGGLIERAYNTQISGCVNDGFVSSEMPAAGVTGTFEAESGQGEVYQIINSVNRGKVISHIGMTAGIAAGVVSSGTAVQIYNCANTGDIQSLVLDGETVSYTSGIVGLAETRDGGTLSFDNCFIGGKLTGDITGLVIAQADYFIFNSIDYTDIITTLSNTKAIGTDDSIGDYGFVNSFAEAAYELNRIALAKKGMCFWIAEEETLGFDPCKHTDRKISYNWNEEYTECVAKVHCNACNKDIVSETANETHGGLTFVYDTLGDCKTHHKGHFKADFYNYELFESQDAPVNTAESEYFGWHTDADRDGVCDVCDCDELEFEGAPIRDESGKFLFTISDPDGKTLRLVSDILIPILNENELYLLSDYTSIQTGYNGKINVPGTVEYNGKTYTVTEIGSAAELDNTAPFMMCTGLTGVTLPDTVRMIGYYAFANCTTLENILIPENVETLCGFAFAECTNLKTITFTSDEAPEVPGDMIVKKSPFVGCENLESIYVPGDSVDAYKAAFPECADVIKPELIRCFEKVEPNCENFGHKAYYLNTETGTYYKDADCTQEIGDGYALEEWLWDYTENGGLIFPLGHIGVPCEDATKGHYCIREGCPCAAGEVIYHTFNEDDTACAECGVPCVKVKEHSSEFSDFYAFYNEFKNDGKPLEYTWYYIKESVKLDTPLIIAGDDVRFVIADNVTFNAAAGYYVQNGSSFDVYYTSRGENIGKFEGELCKCFDENESTAYPEHTDSDLDGKCDRCQKNVTKYIVEDGKEAYIETEKLSVIPSEATELGSGWYIADYNENMQASLSERLKINGDVHIILLDSSKVISSSGIAVIKNNFRNNTLSFYSQSLGEKMGVFETYQITDDYIGSAAIGGSLGNPDAANVNIYGGKFKLYAGTGAAAIGGGLNGDGANVVVYNGDIYAQGSVGAAGIGGGFNGDGKSFTMYGGTVTAKAGTGAVAGQDGSGIGGGYNGQSGTVNIVKAKKLVANGFKALGSGCEAAQDPKNITVSKSLVIKAGASKDSATETDEIGEEQYVEITEPVFTFNAKSLALESELAFRFKGYLNDETPSDDAYMEFIIGDDLRKVEVLLSKAEKDEKGRYVFTCYLNVLEVNEKVRAIFHDGESSVERKNPLSVNDYLDQVAALHTGESEKDKATITLVNAIANYAHYAQKALDESYEDYTVGNEETDTYKAMPTRSETKLLSKEELEAFKVVKTTEEGFTKITKTSRSLTLDDKTAIIIYLTPEDTEYVPSVKVKDEDENDIYFICTKEDDGRFKLIIPNVSANELGINLKVEIDDGKLTFTNLSALSYAYSVFNAGKSDNYKMAVSAMYEYYIATLAYRNA